MYNFKRKSVRLVGSAKEVQEGMRMGPVVGYLEQKSSEKNILSMCSPKRSRFSIKPRVEV